MHRRRVDSIDDRPDNSTDLHLGLRSEALGVATTPHSLPSAVVLQSVPSASAVIMVTHTPKPVPGTKGLPQGWVQLKSRSWALKHRSGRGDVLRLTGQRWCLLTPLPRGGLFASLY